MSTSPAPRLSPSDAAAACYEFAERFPTPNVTRAIAHAERGDVSWVRLERLFHQSLVKGLDAARS